MAFPSLADRLQYDRSAVVEGQLWRIATCHLTHWSFEHLFWDVTALLFLGFVIEQDKRRRLLTCMGLSAAVDSAYRSVPVCPSFPPTGDSRESTPRCSCCWPSALLSDSWGQRDWGWTLVCTAVMGGFAAKMGFEFVTGNYPVRRRRVSRDAACPAGTRYRRGHWRSLRHGLETVAANSGERVLSWYTVSMLSRGNVHPALESP